MPQLSYFQVTGVWEPSSTKGVINGDVTFTMLIENNGVLAAPTLDNPAVVVPTVIHTVIDNNTLQPVSLLANTAPLNLVGTLYYTATFSDVSYTEPGKPEAGLSIGPITFAASTDTTAVSLVDVTPAAGVVAAQITSILVAGISDASTLGRQLLTAPDAHTARSDLSAATFLGPVSSQAAMLALSGNVGDYCYRSDTPTPALYYLLSAPASSVSNWKPSGSTAYLGAVASQAAMLALTANTGDYCYRTDISDVFYLIGTPATSAASWDKAVPAVAAADISDATTLGRQLLTAPDTHTAAGELNVGAYLGAVGSQSAMTALAGNVGDYCYRTDLAMFYFFMPAGAGGVGAGGITVPIPASQLASDVQTKLALAATALQPATALGLLPMFTAADYGGSQRWGGWSHDLAACLAAGGAPANGGLALILLPVRVPVTITNIILGILTAGASLTAGQNFAGLFQGGHFLASTADQSTAWQSTGLKTMALSSPQTVDPANGAVYAAFFANGTTRPAFAVAGINLGMTTLAPGLFRYAFDTVNTGRTTSFPSTLGTLGYTFPFWAAWS